ncbi:hypothetical protein [Streptomyces asiaticus]|uniref:hypothetical protein n=1 Tax=Streptomyces asiaticus TaxID=114695 RepID=UPI003F67D1CB
MTVPHPPVYEAYYTRMPLQLFSGVGWKRLVAFTMERPIRRIGLKSRQGVPDVPGPDATIGPEAAASAAPHIEYPVVRNNRVIVFWKVDHTRLATAMRVFAPQVQPRVHPVHKVVPQGPGSNLGNDSGGSIFDILP